MNIPSEILQSVRRHLDEAVRASRALQDGHITIGECLAIISLAIDWCEFVSQLHGVELCQ